MNLKRINRKRKHHEKRLFQTFKHNLYIAASIRTVGIYVMQALYKLAFLLLLLYILFYFLRKCSASRIFPKKIENESLSAIFVTFGCFRDGRLWFVCVNTSVVMLCARVLSSVNSRTTSKHVFAKQY